jgi:hypothetical protein
LLELKAMLESAKQEIERLKQENAALVARYNRYIYLFFVLKHTQSDGPEAQRSAALCCHFAP